MVEGPKHVPSTTAGHVPHVDVSRKLLSGVEGAGELALHQIAVVNEQVEEWNANPTDGTQVQLPQRRQLTRLHVSGETLTSKKSAKRGFAQIEEFSKHVKGHSPSLQGRTDHQEPPTKRRK